MLEQLNGLSLGHQEVAAAGADNTLASTPYKLTVVKKQEALPPIEDMIADYFKDVDFVVIEGYGPKKTLKVGKGVGG